MDIYTATEQAYKNGYAKGVIEFANYLKEHSFFVDIDNGWHNYNVIDIDDLNDFAKDFLRDK